MFTDKDPPKLNGPTPMDIQLKCGDPIPDQPKLTFSDNCAEDMTVAGTEAEPTGSVCDGRLIQRTWAGPMDECFNKASDINQTISILDQDAPELPASLDDLSYTCPNDFKVDEAVPPQATDDCSTSVLVTGKATPLHKCDDVTITW